jgi:poly(A) polymerase
VKLKELLGLLKQTASNIEVAIPFLCGGTPRDKYMGRLENIADLDITNGTSTINYLSQEFAIQLRKHYTITRKTMEDGHSTIFIGDLKMDFSSNFVVPGIEGMLQKIGIAQPTDMQKEMFSRDFTCNALLMDLDLKQITDPTKRGFADIKNKTIRTCLAPEITLTSNRNRVVRAIYLACKLDFNLDPAIVSYVSAHPDVMKISTEKSMSDKLNEAFKRNPDKASTLLSRMKLWNQVPILPSMTNHYQKHLQGKV